MKDTEVKEFTNEELENTDFDLELEAKADPVQDDFEEQMEKLKKLPYTVKLSRAYEFNDNMIDSVDLSGVEDLTTKDAEDLDRLLTKLNHHPKDKWRDTFYLKHVAMKVTGYPADFFNILKMKDMEDIKSRLTVYFLF